MQSKSPPWLRLLALLAAVACAGECLAADDAASIDDVSVGFNGWFKVGHWTSIRSTIAGTASTADALLEITTSDSDGVSVTTTTPVAQPTYIRSGRINGAVAIELKASDGKLLDRTELSETRRDSDTRRYLPLPSTGELIVQLGRGDLGLESALGGNNSDDGPLTRGVTRIENVTALPSDWFGYDGVDVLVLATSDVEFCDALAADEPRFAALRTWVELGGRLIVLSGRTAPQLLATGKPFAEFVPATVEPLVRLSQTQSIENYAASRDRIGQAGVQQNIPVPLLTNIRGRVELFGRANDVPLIVRAAKGLGEVTFVAIDLTEPPFSEWAGRAALVRAVIAPYLLPPDDSASKQKLVSLGYDDLIGALRQQLGSNFTGVAVIGFPIVALLVIGYLLLLGPLDYLFVEKVARRPWVAWVTLPLIIAGTAAGATLLLGAKRSDGLRLNQAEVVDFDLTTGRTRGACWATLYSPDAERFDISLLPNLPNGDPAAGARTLVSWFGLPGSGLGGMHAGGRPIDVTGVGYQQADDLSELAELPVLTASSKSLQATWDLPPAANAAPPITAELSLDDDGLLVGTLTNNTGALLKNACILAGQWGYQLGDLQPGQQITVGREFTLNRVKTILTRRAGQEVAAAGSTFLANRASTVELLTTLTFYNAIGGAGFAGLPNRYQADLDLSRLLTENRAILVAADKNSTGKNSGSQWQDAATNQPLATEHDESTTVYRFILSLNPQPSSLNPSP